MKDRLKLFFALTVMFLFYLFAASFVSAQTISDEKHQEALKIHKLMREIDHNKNAERWASDARFYIKTELAATGSWIFHALSMQGKRERVPHFQNSQGRFDNKKYIGAALPVAAVKALIAWKIPRARRVLGYINIGVSAFTSSIGVYNLTK